MISSFVLTSETVTFSLKSIDDSWQNDKSIVLCYSNADAWLSLVERCVRDAEVAGSNPVASTDKDFSVGIVQILDMSVFGSFRDEMFPKLFYIRFKIYGWFCQFYKKFYKTLLEQAGTGMPEFM